MQRAGPWIRTRRGIDSDSSCAHTRKLKPRGAVIRWRRTIWPFSLQAVESVARQKDPSGTFMLLTMAPF